MTLYNCRMLSQEESKERFEESDENNDGRVTWKEYVQEIFGIDLDEGSDTIPLNEIEEQQVFLWPSFMEFKIR